MELVDVWLSNDNYQRSVQYLSYSFRRLDNELFSSFNFVPLRESNLTVSSMFFAGICIRLYPILTIGFNTLTFGLRMKRKIEEWTRGKNQEQSKEYYENIKLDEICSEIIRLKKINLLNKDTIRDYYKFYRRTKLGIDEYFDVEESIEPRYHIGRIEYNEKIQPFKDEIFNKYLDTRNSIEHRGTVEASLKDAYNSLSALYLILKNLSYSGEYFIIVSDIFETIAYPSWSAFYRGAQPS